MKGLKLTEDWVREAWIDINEHMNVAYYVLAFDLAIDALWSRLGITDDYIRATHSSTFAVESHVTYQGELKARDPYVVTVELLAYDEKRIHQFQRMYHQADGYLAATAEWMSLHVDLDRRRVSPWPTSVRDELAAIGRDQAVDSDDEPPAELCGRIRVAQPIYSLYGA